MRDRFPEQAESDLTYLVEQKNGDRMIKQLSNSVIAKCRDLSVSRRSVICLRFLLRQIIDLLAIDKSRYFAQPLSIIVEYVLVVLALVIYLLDSIINLINHYSLHNLIAFGSTYPMDCDLSAG